MRYFGGGIGHMTEGSRWRPADEIDVGDVESEELGNRCAKDNSSDTDPNDSDSSEGSDDSSEGSSDFNSDLESDVGAEDGEDMDVDNRYDFL